MKKQIVAFASALALTLSMAPSVALAASTYSPSNKSENVTVNTNGTSVSVSAEITTSGVASDQGVEVQVESAQAPASNYVEVSSEELVASFDVDAYFTKDNAKIGEVGDANGVVTGVTVTVNIGSQYAGKYVKVYVEHSDGSSEVVSGILVSSDGTIAVTLSKLSTFTVVIDNNYKPASDTTDTTDTTNTTGSTTATSATTTSKDTSSKSPYTGVNTASVALVSGVALAAAAGCAVLAFRKSE